MPTPTKGPRLGGSPSHERLMLANLATSLFEHDRITTTEAKAKRLRPLAERLITFAKRGDLHARRRVLSVVRDKEVVHSLFAEIGPGFAERAGGYTRITKVGPRKGDNAPMAVIELVEEEFTAKARTTKKSSPAKKSAPTPEPEVEETTDTSATETDQAADAEQTETDVPATEQVEAQEAVAEQEPEGEAVEEPTDSADESETADEPSDEAADESTEDESK